MRFSPNESERKKVVLDVVVEGKMHFENATESSPTNFQVDGLAMLGMLWGSSDCSNRNYSKLLRLKFLNILKTLVGGRSPACSNILEAPFFKKTFHRQDVDSFGQGR